MNLLLDRYLSNVPRPDDYRDQLRDGSEQLEAIYRDHSLPVEISLSDKFRSLVDKNYRNRISNWKRANSYVNIKKPDYSKHNLLSVERALITVGNRPDLDVDLYENDQRLVGMYLRCVLGLYDGNHDEITFVINRIEGSVFRQSGSPFAEQIGYTGGSLLTFWPFLQVATLAFSYKSDGIIPAVDYVDFGTRS